MDKDDELIDRLIKGGDIQTQDLENHENVKSITEGCDSLFYELNEKAPKKSQ